MDTLSCGNYDVYIAQRNEGDLVCRLSPTRISFNRTLNDYSQAVIEATIDTSCDSCYNYINPWEHEVLIFREGILVWVGPLVNMRYGVGGNRIRLNARDLMAWTEKRFIELAEVEYEVEGVDIREVFQWVLEHGYNKDPWGMEWLLTDTGVPITVFYPGYFAPDRWGGTYKKCGDELRNLTAGGIDYTVINRTMYAGDLEVIPPTDTVLQLSDQNWVVSPEIVVDGARMSNNTGLAGGQGGYYGWYDDQIWFERDEESQERYGLLEELTARPDLSDSYTDELPNAITQEAFARHEFTKHPLSYIEGGQLAGDAPFEFNELIPGIKMNIGLESSIRCPLCVAANAGAQVPGHTCGEYRLSGIDVEVTPDNESIHTHLSIPGVEEVLSS